MEGSPLSLANLGVPPERWQLKGEGAANWVFSLERDSGRDYGELVRGAAKRECRLPCLPPNYCSSVVFSCGVPQHPQHLYKELVNYAEWHGAARSEAQRSS